jgi:hypothetical protein
MDTNCAECSFERLEMPPLKFLSLDFYENVKKQPTVQTLSLWAKSGPVKSDPSAV